MASCASNIGTWMQNVGAAWLMASLTTSPVLIALVQTATSLPVFLLGLPAGVVADLVERRRLLIVTQAWMLAAAAVLGVLAYTGHAGPRNLLALTFALGLGAAMNNPAWQATVPDLVPREELPQAVALNSIQFNIARAVGPALGGLVIVAGGSGGAFLLNAISFVGVLVVLVRWKPVRAPRRPGPRESLWDALWTGLGYVAQARDLHAVLIRMGAFVLGGSALWAMLPVVAKHELGRDATGYGILLGCLGAGSVLGGLALSRLRSRFGPDGLAVSGALIFAAATASLGLVHHFGSLCIAMLMGGVAWLLTMSCFNVAAQTLVPAWVRGRGLSVYLLVFQGGLASGSWLWGEVADHAGLRHSVLAAALTIAVGTSLALRFRLENAVPPSLPGAPH